MTVTEFEAWAGENWSRVLDRLIQQAIVQVLTPIFDPTFSESSFGFRPKRSAHGAAKQVQRIIRQGHAYCVDVDHRNSSIDANTTL